MGRLLEEGEARVEHVEVAGVGLDGALDTSDRLPSVVLLRRRPEFARLVHLPSQVHALHPRPPPEFAAPPRAQSWRWPVALAAAAACAAESPARQRPPFQLVPAALLPHRAATLTYLSPLCRTTQRLGPDFRERLTESFLKATRGCALLAACVPHVGCAMPLPPSPHTLG